MAGSTRASCLVLLLLLVCNAVAQTEAVPSYLSTGGTADRSLLQHRHKRGGRANRSVKSARIESQPAAVDTNNLMLADPPSCKIGVLDMAKLAATSKACGWCGPYSYLAAHRDTGAVFLKRWSNHGKFIEFVRGWPAIEDFDKGANAMPFFFATALKFSNYFVHDPDEADLIFVEDYCYLLRYVAWRNSGSPGQWNPENRGIPLMQVYGAMQKLPRWRKHNGADHVFFHPHPGWDYGTQENVGQRYRNFLCNTTARSSHLVVERAQRNVCPTYDPGTFQIVPLASVLDVSDPSDGPPTPRTRLLAFRGTCGRSAAGTVGTGGNPLRQHVVRALSGAVPDVDMACVANDTAGWLPHADYTALLRSARFCAVVPGDAQSSRHLTEAVLAGCVPVFVGPPWHAMPFADLIDYRSFALFVDVSQGGAASWLPGGIERAISVFERAASRDDTRWWVLDDPAAEPMVRSMPLTELPGFLRGMPEEEFERLARGVQAAQHAFIYQPYPAGTMTDPDESTEPRAVDMILEQLCQSFIQRRGEIIAAAAAAVARPGG